ncbi:MAG: NAD-dependent epimerase/dehydratase family protein [Gammaproteobacteria bacterium]|nr:NAD-dependent epimerase/dehydratase family protein [Gammaproteobacteria bacterium]
MTILVTGASGFVGGALARQLVEQSERVRVLLRPASDTTNISRLDVETVHGDLRDPESLRAALAGCRGLYHVAADYRLWARDMSELYASNVEGTRNIMQAALATGVERIVYTSSVATLGVFSDGRRSDEETPVTLDDMIGDYKRSKFLAEQAVSELIRDAALPAVIVNPSTPVGPGDVKPTPTGRMIRDAALGRMPAYVDTGLNIVHVEDVAHGHRLAFERGEVGRRYILGGEDLSLRDILATVAAAAGRRPPAVRIPRAAVYPIAWLQESWARLTDGAEPQATIDGLKMSRKKMYFDSGRAERELGYAYRPATDALNAATGWFIDRAR